MTERKKMTERDKEFEKQAWVENDWDAYLNVRKLIELIRADEREACAQVCDHMASRCNDIRAAALESAAENIRARGNI
jgi:hypothetical protein